MSKIWIKGEEITAEKLNETSYGLHVISQDIPNMTVHITPGVAIVNNAQVRYTGGNSPTITAPTSNPRIDLVVIKQDGTIEIINGTENTSPVAPLYPSDKLVLAEIYLRVSITKIKASDDSVEGYISLDARPITGVAPSMPAGVIFAFGGSSAPAGFLLCDGSAVSRTTYAVLFAAIGTIYGIGNGSTTFNLPDMRGSVPIGSGQKTILRTFSAPYSTIDFSNKRLNLSINHRLQSGELVSISGSIYAYISGQGTQASGKSVDSAGVINVGSAFAALCPVGTPIYQYSQSSSNFSNGQIYFVISNDGTYITVSQTRGGSLFGSGNAGSVSFQTLVTPRITWSTGSMQAYNTGGSNYLSLSGGYGTTPEVGDVLTVSNQISISPFTSSGTVWYVVEVDIANNRFAVSSTPGGSPVYVSGNGWASFTGVKNGKFFVSIIDKTKIAFCPSFGDAIKGENFISIVDYNTNNYTITPADLTLANRSLGDFGGEEDHQLSVLEMPQHRHKRNTQTTSGSGSGYIQEYGVSGEGTPNDGHPLLTDTGGNAKHENMPPFVVINYIVKT